MKTLFASLVLSAVCLLPSCASGPGGTVTTPVGTTTAQNVGQDQGTANAAESASTSVTVSPTIVNLIGVQRATIQRTPEGGESIEVTGPESANIVISAAANMGVTIGNESARAESSSGGGAAGGAGGAVRQAEASGTQGIAPAPVAPRPVPVTVPGGN